MAITIKELREAIHSGIRASSRKYSKWSRGWTLADSGVEGLIVAEIAAAVHKEQSKDEILLLEVPYDTCLQWSGATPKGRKLGTFKGKRADIALFNTNGQTKYIIEVKRTLSKRELHKDLKKLCDAIAKCAKPEDGNLRRAFLAACATSEAKVESAERWTREFFDSNDSAHTPRTVCVWGESYGEGYSICIEIVP